MNETVEQGRREGRLLWATFVLCPEVELAEAVMRGLPVLAERLDPVALRRAARGGPLPAAGEFVVVTVEQLEAVAEAGPLKPKRAHRRAGER